VVASHRRRPLLVLLAAAVVGAGFASPGAFQQTDPRFPPALETQIGATVAKLSPSERRRIHQGQPVTKLLDSEVTREVAVSGVVWINAPASRYVESIKNIERHESGEGFHVTRRLSTPPKLDDFAALKLPAEDVTDLHSCRIGHCEVQLSEHAISLFEKERHATSPDPRATADQMMRRWLFDLLSGYQEGGNERLPIYRDTSVPTSVASEFKTIVDHSVSLEPYPEIKQYLLGYPTTSLPASQSFFYWQEASFGLKRTIHLSHVTIDERSAETVVVSKMLYATHYFWTALDVRVLVPDPARGSGFWFVTASRTRLNGLSGFTGFFVRRRVRSQVQEGTMKILTTTKSKLESAQ
jgi:hypothetical protein